MKEATPGIVQEMNPDEVIIATGSTPLVPEFPGVYPEKVVSAVDVLLGERETGDDIVVIGGDYIGCEMAVWLAQKGKQVTVVEILADVLQDMPAISPNRIMLLKMLDDARVKTLTGASVSEITKQGIAIRKNGESQVLKADTILAVGRRSERGLVDALEGKLPAVYAIGDCVEPRKILDAIWEAYRIARLI